MATDASPAIVTLTSDFGLSDPYIAAMKGVILGINPSASIIDVTHDVRPQRVLQGTFLTQSAWPYFPPGAVHVVVVDPGVGTERRAVALETPRGRFVGPDNGVLSAALPDAMRPPKDARPVELPAGYRAFSITNADYMRQPASATFHGRDVFAPAAAYLSRGVPIDDLGERADSMVALPPIRARGNADGSLSGHVVHIDSFGNAITDIRAEDLPSERFALQIGDRRIDQFVRTYAEAKSLCVLIGSSGYLEIASPGGSAARELDIDIGVPASLRHV